MTIQEFFANAILITLGIIALGLLVGICFGPKECDDADCIDCMEDDDIA